ncbi:MAG: alpha/beta hydrolase [Gammaproteobacteria bacterium]|nr:alpha/beta hydrolase [Gammaproteobacteria bacterium]MBT8111296.1 alpha/beta hydrolase [Gammaproteobacteria bacterium]NND46055.1 alpha/beta hydrolase [Woeseiaceae bacterium]NNL45994.1 alpha/beta hydrolase [Woeseiaceae bacterium]
MPGKEIYQPRVPRNEREFDIRGANYCIYEWGDPGAPLLVYLHGWADTGSTFQFVVDAFSEEWHVVAPDWRGFGRSSCACTSFWFPDYLADLHALLDIFSPDGPVRLVGHSMGGNVGSLYAGTMPERVRAFVNVEGFGLPDSDPADAPGRYRAWIEAGNAAPRFSEYANLEALAYRIGKRHPAMSDTEALFVAGEWASQGADGVARLRADPRHKLPSPMLYRRAEALACCRAVTAEVLFVEGSNSDFAHRYGHAPTPLFPAAKNVAIDGAGHMPHFEAPRELAAVIEEFLLPTL